MRTVAKLQFTTSDLVAETFGNIVEIIEYWHRLKFQVASDGSTIIRRTGLPAEITQKNEFLDNREFAAFTIVESVPGGRLKTNVDVIRSAYNVNLGAA